MIIIYFLLHIIDSSYSPVAAVDRHWLSWVCNRCRCGNRAMVAVAADNARRATGRAGDS